MSSTTNSPTPEEVEDVLLSCRYGDLEDVQAFVEKFGDEPLKSARDDRGNNVIHMCCGNGHTEVLQYLLPHVPSSLLMAVNDNKSPPLHWAILNNQVECTKLLAQLPEEQGGGLPMLEQKNGAGRDAFDESMWAGEGREEVSGWIEGYLGKLTGDEGYEEPEQSATAEAKSEIKEEEVDGDTVEKQDMEATISVKDGEAVEEARKGAEDLRI
ncbi:hypothetical protein HD553DRAFT_303755 [Filobasidium floriforme]|uniref:uncharacterized protein n=1 Tax=Filobasidium floriforme TaxID=5210 RepID=UPI001E8CE3BE|nr:uncharacterized protein HD553DRAFT_303755 [Filobasidium floriforme]KAH8090938.1 hypothetical protein HD553DRAFT_303755 [Filobasidium floriforme]